MAILIDNQQKNHPVEITRIQKKAQSILNALGSPDDELSIVVVDDERIAVINATYLSHPGPTNVIAFSMREGDYGDINPQIIGDVIISMDTCAREARQAAIGIEERFDQLLVHGILHLFGYDHTRSQAQAREMATKSEALMTVLEKIE